jgi:hypothetical protein
MSKEIINYAYQSISEIELPYLKYTPVSAI